MAANAALDFAAECKTRGVVPPPALLAELEDTPLTSVTVGSEVYLGNKILLSLLKVLVNAPIRKLVMVRCNLVDEQVIDIANKLKGHPHLRVVDLSYNRKLTNCSFTVLYNWLEQSGLTRIHATGTSISEFLRDSLSKTPPDCGDIDDGLDNEFAKFKSSKPDKSSLSEAPSLPVPPPPATGVPTPPSHAAKPAPPAVVPRDLPMPAPPPPAPTPPIPAPTSAPTPAPTSAPAPAPPPPPTHVPPPAKPAPPLPVASPAEEALRKRERDIISLKQEESNGRIVLEQEESRARAMVHSEGWAALLRQYEIDYLDWSIEGKRIVVAEEFYERQNIYSHFAKSLSGSPEEWHYYSPFFSVDQLDQDKKLWEVMLKRRAHDKIVINPTPPATPSPVYRSAPRAAPRVRESWKPIDKERFDVIIPANESNPHDAAAALVSPQSPYRPYGALNKQRAPRALHKADHSSSSEFKSSAGPDTDEAPVTISSREVSELQHALQQLSLTEQHKVFQIVALNFPHAIERHSGGARMVRVDRLTNVEFSVIQRIVESKLPERKDTEVTLPPIARGISPEAVQRTYIPVVNTIPLYVTVEREASLLDQNQYEKLLQLCRSIYPSSCTTSSTVDTGELGQSQLVQFAAFLEGTLGVPRLEDWTAYKGDSLRNYIEGILPKLDASQLQQAVDCIWRMVPNGSAVHSKHHVDFKVMPNEVLAHLHAEMHHRAF